MNKLNDMTQNELNQLFPILLEEHKPYWKTEYEKESEILWNILGVDLFRIHHIGSTSVPGLLAKPTIDILVEVGVKASPDAIIMLMKNAGYIYLNKPEAPAPHMMFLKGYTENGFEGQAFHIHVRYPGDWDELYFRDFLSTEIEFQKKYEMIKRELFLKYRNDREAYTEGKTVFIKEVTAIARKQLYPRYETKPQNIHWKHYV